MPSVVFALQRADGMIAMEHRHFKDTYFPNEWVVPGGKIDPGEHPDDCLAREVLEELGVVVTHFIPLVPAEPIYYRDRVDPAYLVNLYLVDRWTGIVSTHILDTGNPVAWFVPSVVAALATPVTRRVLNLIIEHKYRASIKDL